MARRRRVTILLLAAAEWLYGALLALYPGAFRRRYAGEMRRDFRELSREGLSYGGPAELARVWGVAFSDLALTALKERGTMLVRHGYRPVVAATVAVVFVTVTVFMASLAETPQYESSAKILIGQEGWETQGPSEPVRDIHRLGVSTMTLAEAVDSRPIAEDTIERLGLSTTPKEFLQRLDAEPIENTQFIEVSYTDPNPARAHMVANTLGEVLSQRSSEVSPSTGAITAHVWEAAQIPDKPMSPKPLRNGLLTLVSGLILCVILALVLPGVVASGLGQAALRATRAVVGQPAAGSRVRLTGSLVIEPAKEKELLEALARRGALTVAGAALETSLTVEETEWILSALAAKGHLEVRVEHGRLLYSLWEHDAPL
jgi:capsular polysaccharide biosynthesis protein